MYATIEFMRGNGRKECALVPVLWLTDNNTQCRWPRTKTEDKFKSLVQANAAPEQSWSTYVINRVLNTGDDYSAAEKFMINVLENGTSEDGIAIQPVTQKNLVSDDATPGNDAVQVTESSKNKKKNHHKHKKNNKNNKRRKLSSNSSRDTKDGSQTSFSDEESGTSEDGIAIQPAVTQKNLVSDDATPGNDAVQVTESSKNKRKKYHKHKKNNKNKKRRKLSSNSSRDTKDGSQTSFSDEENLSPNLPRLERSLTGLGRDFSINAKGHDISINADFRTNTGPSRPSVPTSHTLVHSTPQRGISYQCDVIETPRSSKSTSHSATATFCSILPSTPRRSLANHNNAIEIPGSSNTNPNSLDKDILVKIFSHLDRIYREMEQNQIILNQILRVNQALSQVQGATRPIDFPELPISSLDGFDAFDTMIQNEEHRSYLVQRLSSVGGLSQRQAVMNMMKLLMSNSVAMEYNWAGREKRSFKKTHLMKILTEAAKLAFKDKPESSDVNIASAIKDWLKLATSRHTYQTVSGKKNTQNQA